MTRESRDGASCRWLDGVDHLGNSLFNRGAGSAQWGQRFSTQPTPHIIALAFVADSEPSAVVSLGGIHPRSASLRCIIRCLAEDEFASCERVEERGRDI